MMECFPTLVPDPAPGEQPANMTLQGLCCMVQSDTLQSCTHSPERRMLQGSEVIHPLPGNFEFRVYQNERLKLQS